MRRYFFWPATPLVNGGNTELLRRVVTCFRKFLLE